MMKLYIAGPMTGIPQLNFPAFFAAGDLLRAEGYEVVCPAELDMEEGLVPDEGNHPTWGESLARDVKLVSDVADGVALLKGWETSRGARLEAFVALTLQKPVFFVTELNIHGCDPDKILAGITKNVLDQGDVSRYGGTS